MPVPSVYFSEEERLERKLKDLQIENRKADEAEQKEKRLKALRDQIQEETSKKFKRSLLGKTVSFIGKQLDKKV